MFRQVGIGATYMGGSCTQTKDSVLSSIERGRLRILYITPEFYQNSPEFVDQIRQCRARAAILI